jgi:enoyl reductase-like protein|tara:strand:- start:428 stop:679 length:252 start_codon:yes stop_codon:yes gene_type:complete
MQEVKKNEKEKIQETDAIKEAKEVLEAIKTENKKAEALNKETKELRVRDILSGKSEAGIAPVVEEESAKDYAEKVMNGEVELK